jgi:molybdopterin synthase sulfur carrier subunit
MNLKIKLLRPFSDAIGKSELELDFNGDTLKDVLMELISRYPQLKKEFYIKNNELTQYMCVFVNDKPISALNGIETVIKNGDELLFFIPISGG